MVIFVDARPADDFGRTALKLAVGMALAFKLMIATAYVVHKMEMAKAVHTEQQQFAAHMKYLSRRAEERELAAMLEEKRIMRQTAYREPYQVQAPRYTPPPNVTGERIEEMMTLNGEQEY